MQLLWNLTIPSTLSITIIPAFSVSEENPFDTLTGTAGDHGEPAVTFEEHLMGGEPLSFCREDPCYSRATRRNRGVPDCNKGIVASAVALLKTCARYKDLNKGIRIHDYIVEKGLLGKSLYLSNSLVNMYAKCGALQKAERTFWELPFQDVVSWNALISGYVQWGHAQSAFRFFALMQTHGVCPNVVTFTSVLKACGDVEDLRLGIRIHDAILCKKGLFESDVVLGNVLIDMYAKCSMIPKAHQVLDDMPFRETVSWNALITGYTQQGLGKGAWCCFKQMQVEGLLPDIITFTCALKACGCTGALVQGKRIHNMIIGKGALDKSIELGNSLVDMYAKCGALRTAQGVLDGLSFRNVVTWNALITGYVLQGLNEDAFCSFKQMQSEGITPDAITFTCVLKSCGSVGAVDRGKEIHKEIGLNGLFNGNVVLGNALVDMYAKCGILESAQQVLDEMHNRNVVSWSAVISGYTQHGQSETALVCFARMQYDGIRPNAVTVCCILKACGNLGLFEKGKQIHDEIVHCGWLVNDSVLSNALVGMYAKCGALHKAKEVFYQLTIQDVTSWSALIAGYAQYGLAEEAFSLFHEMQKNGFSPNGSIFLSLLSACSHSGLLDEGHGFFGHMRKGYNIVANIEHCTCMIDLFTRAGCYNEALMMLKKMPSFDYLPIWNILLGACQKWGILNLGKVAFEQAVALDSSNAETYVYMANIHAIAGVQADMDGL